MCRGVADGAFYGLTDTMTYQVLARRWRPQDFEQLVGQSHVLKALIHALNEQRQHHAYLFTGTRGVGKTTIARIIAKCLNCEKGVSAKPCHECSACTQITEGRFVDLIEIDAASRTRVEDTRELLDNVQYRPTNGRYKIYLIDEVHMLSNHSFNALLKTLEEPPEHVIFLLATTDPQKLPATVLSRCLQFHLNNLLPEQIAGQLKYVLEQEKINFEPQALSRLSMAANGSMRDGLSLLDQAIASGEGQVTQAAVDGMLGGISEAHLSALLRALQAQDAEQIIAITSEMAQAGVSFEDALQQLLIALHQMTVLQRCPEAASETMLDKALLTELANQLSPEEIQLNYQIALMGQRDNRFAPTPRVGFEMSLLRMLAFAPVSEAKSRPKAKTSQPKAKAASTSETQAEPEPAPSATPKKTQPAPVATDWAELLKELPLYGMALMLAQNCQLQKHENKQITLHLDPAHCAMNTEALRVRIQAALNDYFGDPIKLEIIEGDTDISTPAAANKSRQQAQTAQANQSIDSDEHVKAIMQQFDATIVPGSVKATEK
jgi:DNA polymerase III subunit gamma/tau